MPENESRKPEEVLTEILSALKSEDAETRLQAIQQLHEIQYSSEAIRNELEKLALRDAEENIRAQALSALDLATQKNVRAHVNRLTPQERRVIGQEIQTWQESGLLNQINAEVIRKRYNFDFAPKVAPPPEVKPAPEVAAPTLTQTLLSETSIKIALYLGAFFIISSAAIFAALIEIIRLPILILGTLLFGGLAVAIKKRLPQPSFTLFVVFSFLLPITANVLEESLHLSPPFIAAYWVFVSSFMALIWAGGTWLYESRLFSVTAFVSFTVALYRVGDVFDAESEFYPIMLGLAALLGLLGVWLLKRWRDGKFALPLFLSAQLLQTAVILATLMMYFSHLFAPYMDGQPLWNLAHILTWGFAFAFYIFSNQLYPFFLFPWFAAGALLGFPFFLGAAFAMNELSGAITFAVWGFILAAASEAAHWLEKIRRYNLPFLAAAIFSAVYGISVAFANNETTGFFTALWFALIFSALHVIRPRGWVWAIALLGFITAYFTFFHLPFMADVEIFFGYQLLGLSFLLLLPDLFSSNAVQRNPQWRIPPRVFGAVATFINLWVFLFANEPLKSVIGFGAGAVFFSLYMFAQRKSAYLYLPAAYLALTLIYALTYFEIERWHHALILLAAVYYGLGFTLRALKILPNWDSALLFSGLGAGAVASIGALIFGGLDAAIPPALAATLFAVEAFARKNVWLGFPANGFYLLAYFIILIELKVDQPQLYSIGAALLGMIQHYLLTRAESKIGTFMMGMVSQLTLLGTTYIQMAGNENLLYFFVLFFQAMVVIFYGVVTRSRSLTFTPIGIIVLGLFTVLYSALKGLGAVVLVGCSGVVLLLLGILAVILRERISNLGERLSDWKA